MHIFFKSLLSHVFYISVKKSVQYKHKQQDLIKRPLKKRLAASDRIESESIVKALRDNPHAMGEGRPESSTR